MRSAPSPCTPGTRLPGAEGRLQLVLRSSAQWQRRCPDPRNPCTRPCLKTIAAVIGTRPEAIKMAPIVLALRRPAGFASASASTGQHREMLDQVLDDFGIVARRRSRPDAARARRWPTLTAAGPRSASTRLCAEERPDLVLVQGDTTTVFCRGAGGVLPPGPGRPRRGGAAHRATSTAPSPRRSQPRPRRRRLAALHFAPTARARDNLLREGVAAGADPRHGQHGASTPCSLTLERLLRPERPGARRRPAAWPAGRDRPVSPGHRPPPRELRRPAS